MRDRFGRDGIVLRTATAIGILLLINRADPAAASIFDLFQLAPPSAAVEPVQPLRPAPVARPKRNRVLEQQKRQQIERSRAAKGQASDPLKSLPGPHHVVISLEQQQLTLYANGVPVAHSPVSTGVPGHPTPTGIFSIIQRRRFHHSNIYSGAPMPFMQRITWSGIALHAGIVPGHPASHGCIRLPASFAERLWGITKIGARVIIARHDPMLADISHPRLPEPRKPSLPQALHDVENRAPVKLAAAASPSIADAPQMESAEIRGSIVPEDPAETEAVQRTAVVVETPVTPDSPAEAAFEPAGGATGRDTFALDAPKAAPEPASITLPASEAAPDETVPAESITGAVPKAGQSDAPLQAAPAPLPPEAGDRSVASASPSPPAEAKSAATDSPMAAPSPAPIESAAKPAAPAVRPGPVSIFVSRKAGKLYVRKGFAPVFDAPVQISQADRPLGTHVFTAMDYKSDGVSLRWTVLSLPADAQKKSDANPKLQANSSSRPGAKGRAQRAAKIEQPFVPSAAEALDRITIAPEIAERITEWMAPGASFIVSDNSISHETGLETDFVVLTR